VSCSVTCGKKVCEHEYCVSCSVSKKICEHDCVSCNDTCSKKVCKHDCVGSVVFVRKFVNMIV
jgi:hypothetical protein